MNILGNKTYPTEPEHLQEYALVSSGGEVLLGKCGEVEAVWGALLPNAIKVENAYIVLGGYAPTNEGKIVRPRVLAPLEALASSAFKIVVPDSIFPLHQLDVDDKRAVLKEIADAEKRRMEMRAKKSGLVTGLR